jgi:hypothetical protein
MYVHLRGLTHVTHVQLLKFLERSGSCKRCRFDTYIHTCIHTCMQVSMYVCMLACMFACLYCGVSYCTILCCIVLYSVV